MNELSFQQGVPAAGGSRKVAWVLSILGLLSMILVCVGAYGVMNTKDVIVVEATPEPVAASGGLAAPVAEDAFAFQSADEFNWKGLGWLVGIGLGLYVFYKVVIETGFWKILLGLGAAALAMVFLFWMLLYRGGDVSTPDARDANMQVVEVVQPVGDPVIDEAYAGINTTNAGANLKNTASNAIYIILALGGMVVVVGLFVVGHYAINK